MENQFECPGCGAPFDDPGQANHDLPVLPHQGRCASRIAFGRGTSTGGCAAYRVRRNPQVGRFSAFHYPFDQTGQNIDLGAHPGIRRAHLYLVVRLLLWHIGGNHRSNSNLVGALKLEHKPTPSSLTIVINRKWEYRLRGGEGFIATAPPPWGWLL
jgi:hypothetical protein